MSAAQRARRARAAAALADTPRRAQLGWDDLAAWPAWADLDDLARDRLLWAAGAWFHAPALRRSIDGRLLARLGERLGADDAARLLAPDATAGAVDAGGASEGMPEDDGADALLLAAGRECALASVPSALLRLVLRERHWPDTLAPMPAPDTAAAIAAMQAAGEPA